MFFVVCGFPVVNRRGFVVTTEAIQTTNLFFFFFSSTQTTEEEGDRRTVKRGGEFSNDQKEGLFFSRFSLANNKLFFLFALFFSLFFFESCDYYK